MIRGLTVPWQRLKRTGWVERSEDYIATLSDDELATAEENRMG